MLAVRRYEYVNVCYNTYKVVETGKWTWRLKLTCMLLLAASLITDAIIAMSISTTRR